MPPELALAQTGLMLTVTFWLPPGVSLGIAFAGLLTAAGS